MPSSYRFKETERPYSCTSFPYVHYKHSSKLRSKRRLRVQNRPVGCILSRTYPSQQQKVPQVHLREQGFHSIGAHGDRLLSLSGDLDNTIARRLVNSPPGPPSSTPTSGSAHKYAGPSQLYPKQKEIRAGPDTGSPVSRNPFTSGEASLPESKAWEIVARARHLSSLQVLTYSQVFQLMGLMSYPSIRPTGPCQPSKALAGPTFSYLRNPYPHVSGGLHEFYGSYHSGLGRSHGGFPDFGYLDPYRPQASYQLYGAQGSALKHWAPMLQGHQVMIATDNSTVVLYINKQGGTRSPTLLRLTVELLLWLEAQNIIVRARHIPGCLNVIADHLSRPNQPIPTEWSLHPEIVKRIFGLWGTPEVDMFATVSNSHLPRFMSPVPEPRALAVDALSQDWQGMSMYMFPPFPLKLRSTQAAEVILIAPWWPKQSWFPHLLRLCVEHPLACPYR